MIIDYLPVKELRIDRHNSHSIDATINIVARDGRGTRILGVEARLGCTRVGALCGAVGVALRRAGCKCAREGGRSKESEGPVYGRHQLQKSVTELFIRAIR